MKQIGIAIVGTGEIAQNFHLPILRKNPAVKILAVCDIIKTKARSVAEKYDIPYVCDSVAELLTIDAIEAVHICTSTDAHCETALACIDAGKHVLIEKPLGRTLSEAKQIAEAAAGCSSKVMVGINQRFRYDAKMLKNYIQMGEIGKVFYAKAGWLQERRGPHWKQQIEKSGGGVLIDLGLPLIDSLMWIYDFMPVRSVIGSMYYNRTESVEDVCVATINFADGSLATLEASWSLFNSQNNFYCDVYGSEGSAGVNPLKLFKSNSDAYKPVQTIEQPTKVAIHRKSYESEINHFINAVQGFLPVASTAREAVQTMRIIEAIYLSAKERREISIKDDYLV